MKNVAFILFFCCFTYSCNNNDESNEKSACGVENPIENLAWLKSEIEQREQNEVVDYQYSYIMQTSFEKQDIFIYGDCNPLANSVITVYNCSGENIGYLGDDKFPVELLQEGIVIWKAEGYQCAF